MTLQRLIAALVCTAALFSTPSAHAATVEQWRRDIDQMVAHIGAVHPRPRGEIGRLAFLRQAETLKADTILAGHDMRGVAVIARMEGGAAARALDNTRRPAFERASWWRPINFNAVKTVGYDLPRANRAADAIEMFMLMTELYPDHWNSWESLGRAQTAANELPAARASYRCALALDPENFDAGDLRAALRAAPDEAPTIPAACRATLRPS